METRGIDAPDDMSSGPVYQAQHPSLGTTPPFNPDGTLKPEFLDRTDRIIKACDRLGMVVILGYFYFGQDERLDNEAAVCKGVDEATKWILDTGHGNVLIEINNETNIPRYEHEILQPHRVR